TVRDASGDDTPQTVFQDGALRVNYDFSSTAGSVTGVTIQALQNGTVTNLGVFTDATGYEKLVNLDGLATPLPAGDYQVRAIAQLASGTTLVTPAGPLTVLSSGVPVRGTFKGWTFGYTQPAGSGVVY